MLLRTGWSARTDPKQYINLQDDGPHTPGFVKECSDFLAKERDVLGVGVETVGTDAGRAATFDPPFPNHYVMHGSGKFGLAGLCNLDQLPPTGAVVIAAPLKIVNGSGSPAAGDCDYAVYLKSLSNRREPLEIKGYTGCSADLGM